MRALALGLLVSCAALLPVGPRGVARAASDVEAAAKAHFEAGARAFNLGDYDAAVAEFAASYALKPFPDLLVNIAQCYERVYKPERAREHYERFLAEAAPDAELRPLAEKRLRVLRRLPGSILVAANKDATIVLTGPGDFRESAPAPHRWNDLPPGPYHVRITLPDHEPVEEDITLAPGETQDLSRRLVHQTEQVTIFSVPDGARVFVDDREEGATPFTRTLETGRGRRLRLEAPDFPPHRELFDLQAGRPYFRRIPLQRPRGSGRTELVLGAMAYGGFVSSAVAVTIGGPDVTTGTGLIILVPTAIAGVGAGFLAGWFLTDDNLKIGTSSVLIGSTLAGGLVGTEIAFGLGLNEITGQKLTQQNTVALALLGSGLGLGAGILSAWLADPTPGDAAMVNSGTLWGAATGVLLTEALDLRRGDHDHALGWISLGTTVSGIALSALLTRYLEVSRAQVAIVDAATLVGGVLGYGIGYAAGDNTIDPQSATLCPSNSVGRCVSAARYALGGLAVGLLAAAILTRRFEANLPRADALLTHHDDRWALGLPSLRFHLARAPEGLDHQAIVDLVRGEF